MRCVNVVSYYFMNLKQCDMSEVIRPREVRVVEECRVSFSPVVFDDLAEEHTANYTAHSSEIRDLRST